MIDALTAPFTVSLEEPNRPTSRRRSADFVERGLFADHRPDPLSLLMERDDRPRHPDDHG